MLNRDSPQAALPITGGNQNPESALAGLRAQREEFSAGHFADFDRVGVGEGHVELPRCFHIFEFWQ